VSPPPLPHVGAVIDYPYLWRSPTRGADASERPCLIVLVDTSSSPTDTTVGICPITGTEPDDSERAIGLRRVVCRPLGLSSGRRWVVTSELATFVWPEAGARRSALERGHRGAMPADVTGAVKRALVRNSVDGQLVTAQQDR